MANDAGQATISELLKFLYRETKGSQLRIIVPSVITGLSRGALLAIFNAGAAEVGGHKPLNLELVGAFAAGLAFYLAAEYVAGRSSDNLVRLLIHRLRLQICEKLIHAPLRLVEAQDPGKIFTHIGHEVERLAAVAKDFIISFQAALVLVFALAYLGWLSWPSFVAAVLTIGIGSASYYWQERKAKARYRLAREKEVEYFDAMYDLLHGFKELKLGRAQQGQIMGHLRMVSDEFRALGASSQRLYQVSELTSQAFTFSLIAIIVFLLPVLFPSSSTSVYQLLATVLYILAPVEQMISSVPSFSQGAVALANIEHLERTVGREYPHATPGEVPASPAAFDKIALRDVHFEFRGATEDESFDLGPINLDIRRGECLFICGGNGAGKTTLLKLIAGLYQPTSGEILLDRQEISGLRYVGYRELFGAVFSDAYLMRRLYGLTDLDPASVRELLVHLQLDKKTQLKDGQFTATRLSTGQRKRLAYAISRLRDRQIYVFDEFAADQDPAFRQFFYTVLLPELKQQGKTVVAVTHDDRWFGAGDRLVKLDYGKIVSASD